MIYPKNLNKNEYIGVIATSKRISKDMEILKIEKAKENFKLNGHNIIESNNIMKNEKARSSSREERANEFFKLWNDKDVKAILTLKGGQFLIEMLSFYIWKTCNLQKRDNISYEETLKDAFWTN